MEQIKLDHISLLGSGTIMIRRPTVFAPQLGFWQNPNPSEFKLHWEPARIPTLVTFLLFLHTGNILANWYLYFIEFSLEIIPFCDFIPSTLKFFLRIIWILEMKSTSSLFFSFFLPWSALRSNTSNRVSSWNDGLSSNHTFRELWISSEPVSDYWICM